MPQDPAALIAQHAHALVGAMVQHPDAIAFLIHPSCDLHRTVHGGADNVEILADRCVVFMVEPDHAAEILWAICEKKLPVTPPNLRTIVVLSDSSAYCSAIGIGVARRMDRTLN